MGWAFFYMFVVLKIPIAAALWLVWWATRSPEEQEHERSDEDGGSRRHRHPRGRPLTPPRRGPHAEPPPRPPDRVRVASGTTLDRTHR
ncbi:MAG TPA: hypothetical protein VIM03_00880 [Thermoleophilaceae bacterium]